MSAYMYLFFAPKHLATAARAPDQARENIARWRAWEEALRKGGHAPTGGHLESAGNRISAPERKVSEGVIGDELVMGGYFIVEASSLEEATELAKGCPLLANVGTVEVRPLRS
jgi:hypothetical protein